MPQRTVKKSQSVLKLQTSLILKDTQDIIDKSLHMKSDIKELADTIVQNKKDTSISYRKVKKGIDRLNVLPFDGDDELDSSDSDN